MGTEPEEEPEVRRVVCDTGPILHLLEIGALYLLDLTGEVLIPHAVDSELEALVTDWPEKRPPWLHVQSLDTKSAGESAAWQASGMLHSGEAESLELARTTNSDWYLADDAAARVLAVSLGIEVHGTIGVVLWAAATGHLGKPDATIFLEKLAQSSLWVSPRVLAEAKAALDDLVA